MGLRALLGVVGAAVAAWGVLLLADLEFSGLVSAALWAGGAVAVHDAVVAPLTAAVGIAVARLSPARARRGVGIALAVWALLTVAVANVTFAPGGRSDNPSLLPGEYLAWWAGGTVLTAVVVAALVWRGRDREGEVAHHRGEGGAA